jgi:hypothetical protein
MTTGQVVNITGHTGSTPAISGNYTITEGADANKFTIPVNVSSGGTGGTAAYNHDVGYSLTGPGYEESGWLEQSPTNFHSGSILKDFRFVSVAHDSLPNGAGLTMLWEIDGMVGSSIGVTSGQETHFLVNQQGYLIKTKLGMTNSTDASLSPIVKSVNVIWDFVKKVKHQYLLDCRNAAAGGRWSEDPETAIAFLFATADQRATFEDLFEGEYTGTIEEIKFVQANRSISTGYEGLVSVTVREE